MASFLSVVDEVMEGETNELDRALLLTLRQPGQPDQPDDDLDNLGAGVHCRVDHAGGIQGSQGRAFPMPVDDRRGERRHDRPVRRQVAREKQGGSGPYRAEYCHAGVCRGFSTGRPGESAARQ